MAGDRNEYGEWVPAAAVENQVDLVTVPLTGEDREQLPEALRLSDVRKFFLAEAAETLRAGESDGDIIRYPATGGNEYRIVMVKDWGSFREVMAVRPEEEPSALGRGLAP